MKYFLQTLMFLCLIFSFLFIIIGLRFSESAIQEASAAAFACYFGVLVRVLQAETHNISKEVKKEDKCCGNGCQDCNCIS
jgi:hypothetical protein